MDVIQSYKFMTNLSKKEKSAVVFVKNNAFECMEPYFCLKRRESYEAYWNDNVFLSCTASGLGAADP